LRLSPLNARSVKPKAIESLAADIEAHGLLQNLIGYEAEDKVMICAGGRRYRALKRLQKAKTITPSYEVSVDIRSIDDALELSLAENVQREAMHPADAILAYRALVDGAMDAEDIAVRFGVSVDHVRRLLRLSGLHPKLIAAMKRDELSIASAKALAICDDHELQWAAFKQAGDNPRGLRSLLTDAKLSCHSALFQLVGEQAYRQAGGTITRDLFSSDDEAFADDVQLVRSLADIRLGELAEVERADGWGTVNHSIERPDNFYALPTLYPDAERELTGEEQEQLETIAAKLNALEEEGVVYYDNRIRDLEVEQRRIKDGIRYHSDDQKLAATLYLFVGYHGLEKHPVGKPKSRHGEAGASKPKPDYPAAVLADLGTIRTLAVREAVAKQPVLALNLLLDHMLGQLVGEAYSFEQALDLKVETSSGEAKPELVDGQNFGAITAMVSELLPRMQGDGRGDAIEGLAQQDKLGLLAFCVASQITSADLSGAKGQAIGTIAAKAGVDMKRVWTPNAAFFMRLTKPVMLELLRANCGEEAMLNCKRLKKADLAQACAVRLVDAGYYPPCLDNNPPWDIGDEVAKAA